MKLKLKMTKKTYIKPANDELGNIYLEKQVMAYNKRIGKIPYVNNVIPIKVNPKLHIVDQ